MASGASIDRLWSPDEADRVLDRARKLFGPQLDDMVQRYKAGLAAKGTPPRQRHRLVEMMVRIENAVAAPNSILEGAAAVNIGELDAALELFEHWMPDPAWIEYWPTVTNANGYRHGVATLAIADDLKVRHDSVELIATKISGRSADLRMVVSDDESLQVEVKAPEALWQRGRDLDLAEAMEIVRKCLRRAGTGPAGQLGGDMPVMLVIAASDLSEESCNTMSNAIEMVLKGEDGRRRPRLLGVVLAQTQNRFESKGTRFTVLTQRHSRIRRNRHYTLSLQIDGDWGDAWKLRRT